MRSSFRPYSVRSFLAVFFFYTNPGTCVSATVQESVPKYESLLVSH